ncbi:MAG: helix-turn-helix transcriptional regulator [Lachnospiraceae bacterium]|jgi:plasmid maintenance system antidote protein VapI|nr:helix-turn-helix transcriptional regulator [Lachnospiraceae bacterium]
MGKCADNSKKNLSNVLAGRNLLYFIESIGMSREELAKTFGIEKDAVNKILNGTNAISGPYNDILLNELDCDLNFIYGGVARSDMLINEVKRLESEESKVVLKHSVHHMMGYLLEILKALD